jgi:hypothetical protein
MAAGMMANKSLGRDMTIAQASKTKIMNLAKVRSLSRTSSYAP